MIGLSSGLAIIRSARAELTESLRAAKSRYNSLTPDQEIFTQKSDLNKILAANSEFVESLRLNFLELKNNLEDLLRNETKKATADQIYEAFKKFQSNFQNFMEVLERLFNETMNDLITCVQAGESAVKQMNEVFDQLTALVEDESVTDEEIEKTVGENQQLIDEMDVRKTCGGAEIFEESAHKFDLLNEQHGKFFSNFVNSVGVDSHNEISKINSKYEKNYQSAYWKFQGA